ncbi:hypothetical protein [Corynebacterium senegalense]|uniref:hypothetical protein n=1 Tax=Corynebacterium senegalense TaxID=2080750 RepID=UPI0011C04668|nr:hypothetical protein [Corynebacterium senegalense]
MVSGCGPTAARVEARSSWYSTAITPGESQEKRAPAVPAATSARTGVSGAGAATPAGPGRSGRSRAARWSPSMRPPAACPAPSWAFSHAPFMPSLAMVERPWSAQPRPSAAAGST